MSTANDILNFYNYMFLQPINILYMTLNLGAIRYKKHRGDRTKKKSREGVTILHPRMVLLLSSEHYIRCNFLEADQLC